MRRSPQALRLAVPLAAAFSVAACSPRSPAPPQAELAGDPLGAWRATSEQAYARNLWDLQTYRGRLYLGYGDAITNTGPTDVIAFDPARRVFEHETTLPEEAILTYHVFGDRLFVPGADAVDSDDGALYVRDAAGWTPMPLPQAAHVLDVAVHGAEICVVVQDRQAGGVVRCIADTSANWRTYPTASWRAVSLFELGGELYVSSHDSGVRRVDGGRVAFVIPGVTDDGNVLVRHATGCGDEVVFIAVRVRYEHDSAQVDTLGLFRASISAGRPGRPGASADAGGAITVARIELPGTPADVFAHDGRCYAVTNRPRGEAFDVAIHDSTDNRTWRPRASFPADAMARSGELLGGYFYIGLGCELGHCTPAAGRLLRIAAPP